MPTHVSMANTTRTKIVVNFTAKNALSFPLFSISDFMLLLSVALGQITAGGHINRSPRLKLVASDVMVCLTNSFYCCRECPKIDMTVEAGKEQRANMELKDKLALHD